MVLWENRGRATMKVTAIDRAYWGWGPQVTLICVTITYLKEQIKYWQALWFGKQSSHREQDWEGQAWTQAEQWQSRLLYLSPWSGKIRGKSTSVPDHRYHQDNKTLCEWFGQGGKQVNEIHTMRLQKEGNGKRQTSTLPTRKKENRISQLADESHKWTFL